MKDDRLMQVRVNRYSYDGAYSVWNNILEGGSRVEKILLRNGKLCVWNQRRARIFMFELERKANEKRKRGECFWEFINILCISWLRLGEKKIYGFGGGRFSRSSVYGFFSFGLKETTKLILIRLHFSFFFYIRCQFLSKFRTI